MSYATHVEEHTAPWWERHIVVLVLGAGFLFFALFMALLIWANTVDSRTDACVEPREHAYLLAHYPEDEAYRLASLECRR
jgi:hypothetical protein